MFDGSAPRRRGGLILLAVGVAVAGGIGWVGDPVDRLSVLVGGGNPLGRPVAADHHEQVYPESPLAVSLELERGFGPVDRDGVLAWADRLARDLGWWMLATTGTGDVEAAERSLWAHRRIDDFAAQWALAMQDREVHSRRQQGRLSTGVPAHGPRYAQPEEIALVLAHVAWTLDLDAVLVRSPVHWYLELREPGGSGVRGVEPTALWAVDRLGKVATTQEPQVGARLSFPADHYSSGAGGIKNPSPLPVGAYQPISADALTSEILAWLGTSYEADPARLEQRLAQDPSPALAQAVFRSRLSRGLAAHDRGDLAEVRAEAMALDQLRSAHPDLLPPAPDEQVLDAMVSFGAGDDHAGLEKVHAVLAYYEPDGAPLFARSDAHAAAMWLELEHGVAQPEDWNGKIVPLLNRNRHDPAVIARLCALGKPILARTKDTPQSLVPECASPPAQAGEPGR